MAGNSLAFELRLADKLSGPAMAGAQALKTVERNLKAVRASSQGITPMKQIAVGSKATDKSIAADQAKAEKAANKQRVADERATAKAILAQEKALQAEKKAMQKAAAAEWKAIDKRNAAQAKEAAKAEVEASKEITRAQKAAAGEATKLAKKKAADVKATGESFAAEAAVVTETAAAAATAVLALAAAFGAAVVAGAGLAISARSAKDDTLEMLEAVLGSQEAALDTYDAIKDITRDVGISQAAAQELAQSLTAAGITNRDMLLDATKSIAQVDSVIKGAGQKIQNIVEEANAGGKFNISAQKLVGTGVQMQDVFENIAAATGKGVKQVEAELKAGKISAEVGVAALTKTIDTKFGAIAAGRAKGFDESIQRLKDNISSLFEDVDIEPFEKALASIVDLFDENTSSGKVLKETVTGIFNGLFKTVSKVAPYVKTFFKGLIILGLEVYIALQPLLDQFDLLGDTTNDNKSGADSFADAMLFVADAVSGVVTQIVKLLSHKTVLYILAGAAALVVLPLVLMYGALGLAVVALGALVAAGAAAIDWLLNLGQEAWDAGSALVTGLVNGVVSAGGKLLDTVKNLGTKALKAFKGIFKIASPSRVMMGVGENISLGLAHGIANGGQAVNDNMTEVVDPIRPPKATGGGTARGSVTLSGVQIKIEIHGVKDAQDLEDRMPEIMANALERAGQTLGLNPSAEDAA